MLPKPVKDVLRLILATLLPVAFIALKTLYPDFPLSQDTFVNLVIWVVGLLLGGWNLNHLWRNYIVKS
jgi:hypothetical protein